jgi:hypothetical protein
MTMTIFMILKISIKSVLIIITKILCFQIKTVSHFFYILDYKNIYFNLNIKIIIQVLSLIT